MLPRVDLSLRPISSIDATNATNAIGKTGASKQDNSQQFEQFVVGKQIQGKILYRLNDGTFFVRLAGMTARMALPQSNKSGDIIPLTYISNSPRPTFLLENNTSTIANFSRQGLIDNFLKENQLSGSTGTSKSNNLNLNVNVFEEASSVDVTTLESILSSNPTNLSDTGKLINKILFDAQQLGGNSILTEKTPLLQNEIEIKNTPQLAQNLQQTIELSGLFYEAHIGKWANGSYPLSSLMREPQAQQTADLTQLNQSNDANSDIPIELTKIIQSQLDTLEKQRIQWQGNLLPGVPFQWEISRKEKNEQKQEKESEPVWNSTLQFELPHLGVIMASIQLVGEKLQLSLRTDSNNSEIILKNHQFELSDAINQTGTKIQSLVIKHNE